MRFPWLTTYYWIAQCQFELADKKNQEAHRQNALEALSFIKRPTEKMKSFHELVRSTSNISNHIPDYDLNFEDCDNKDEELICYNDEDQATENEDGMSTPVKNISSKKRKNSDMDSTSENEEQGPQAKRNRLSVTICALSYIIYSFGSQKIQRSASIIFSVIHGRYHLFLIIKSDYYL